MLTPRDAPPIWVDAPPIRVDALPIPEDALRVRRASPCRLSDALLGADHAGAERRACRRIRGDAVRRRRRRSRRVRRSLRASRGTRPIPREPERAGRELFGARDDASRKRRDALRSSRESQKDEHVLGLDAHSYAVFANRASPAPSVALPRAPLHVRSFVDEASAKARRTSALPSHRTGIILGARRRAGVQVLRDPLGSQKGVERARVFGRPLEPASDVVGSRLGRERSAQFRQEPPQRLGFAPAVRHPTEVASAPRAVRVALRQNVQPPPAWRTRPSSLRARRPSARLWRPLRRRRDPRHSLPGPARSLPHGPVRDAPAEGMRPAVAGGERCDKFSPSSLEGAPPPASDIGPTCAPQG
jgi:hypothetical protein